MLVTLDVVWSLILQFGTKTNDAVQLLMSADTLMLMIYWTICRTFKSRWTFAVAPIYLLIHTIELNLLVRDNVAPVFKVVDKKINQNELIYYFLEANLINYMDFRYTVFLLVPLFVLGNVFIQKKIDEIKSGEGILVGSESDTDNIHMVMLALLFIAFQYLSQV